MGKIQPGVSQGAPAAPAAPTSTQEDRGGSGPIIVTAEMAPQDQAWADRQRARFYPAERNVVGAHITLFRHLPPSCLDELKQLLGRISGQSAPAARIDRLLAFGQGVAYHVESPGLLAIHEELAERFAGLLTPQDSARPQLHITIQNKVAPGEARSTVAELQAGFSPRRITIRGIGVWRYRGGPWSPMARYAFRM